MTIPECADGGEHSWMHLMFGENWCSICEFWYFPDEEDES